MQGGCDEPVPNPQGAGEEAGAQARAGAAQEARAAPPPHGAALKLDQFLFSDPMVLVRTAVVGVLAYIALIAILRVSGKRTLSKMNAFDLVVTVALGSTLATILLNKEVTLAQGALAFALLVALQYLITWSSVRVGWIRGLVAGEPALLVRHGKCLPAALRRARVTEDEVRAAARSAGLRALEEAESVVLETDGSFSVIRRQT